MPDKDTFVVKVQLDMTGSTVLLTGDRLFHQVDGERADEIRMAYDMRPLSRVFVRGSIDEKGLLQLGERLND